MSSIPLNQQTRVDMAAARAQSTLATEPITHWLHGGKSAWEERTKLIEIVSHEHAVNNLKANRDFMSREELYAAGQAAINRLNELRMQHNWSDELLERALQLTGEILPSNLHAIAFLPVILRQGTDAQIAQWARPASARAIVGCYAQTELGHGTDVAELETTATFDTKADEFVLHSPSVTSSKWWVGALGRTATHAVVQAQLVLGGKRVGPHLFVVQLRDMTTLDPLPGRTIGDIGPKAFAGHATVDHGYMRFDHVRIPRSQMLSRFTSVSRDGKYHAGPHAKLSYGGMLYIRAHMNLSAASTLSQATTIAIRYCTVRRQGKVGADGLAPSVVAYSSTYYRLLPLIARSYVWNIIARDMLLQYDSMSAELARGDATQLPVVHAALAGLKSLITADVLHGVDTARRSLGGHGFSAFAGLGRLWAQWAPSVTYEGDNYVLDKQVVRAMLKAAQLPPAAIQTLGTDSFFACLATAAPTGPQLNVVHSTAGDFAYVLQLRAAAVVRQLADRIAKSGEDDAIRADPGIEARSSKAVTEAFVASRVFKASANPDLPGGEVVREVLLLYLLVTIETALPDLFEYGIAHPSDGAAIRSRIGDSCARLLPEAIGLVDAFGWTDWELDSALGVHDGSVYDTLWQKASTTGFNTSSSKEYKGEIRALLQRGQQSLQGDKARL